jgi:cytochrome c-type biogenesis protein CcmH
MNLLWFSLLFLTLIASAFIVAPLWREKKLDEKKQQLANKDWYLERMAELQQAFAAHKIDANHFESSKTQLQKDFLMLSPQLNMPNNKNQTQRLLAVFLSISFGMSAFLLYQKLGASHELQQQLAQASATNKVDDEIKAMGGSSGVIQKLKQKLIHQPKNAEGWYLLGKIYLNQNNFIAARIALEHAVKWAPQREDIAIELVEASYLSADSRAASRLTQALKRWPQDPTLLNIDAVMLYHQKKYEQALIIWQNLLLQIPAGSDAEKSIQAAINQAKIEINNLHRQS